MVRTVPRLDNTAYLYARIVMPRASSPILAGQVSLFRDGVFAGIGKFPQLAPGEEYELEFGADDRVKVKRIVLEQKSGEAGTLTTSFLDERRYAIAMIDMCRRGHRPATPANAMKTLSSAHISAFCHAAWCAPPRAPRCFAPHCRIGARVRPRSTPARRSPRFR